MIKRFKDFIQESNQNSETFNFIFIEECEECEGSGTTHKEKTCPYCSGSGIGDLGYEDKNGTYHKATECDRCDGKGEWEEDLDCEDCNKGFLEWNLRYIQYKGIKTMEEKSGNCSYIKYYEDVHYYPKELKNIVEHIFDNKDLNKKDIVNSVARFIFEKGYTQFQIPQDMIDLFDEDTKRLMSSYSSVHKFDL